MIKYTALCDFTCLVAGNHKQFVKGEVYETEIDEVDIDSYIQHKFVVKEVIQKPATQPSKKIKQ